LKTAFHAAHAVGALGLLLTSGALDAQETPAAGEASAEASTQSTPPPAQPADEPSESLEEVVVTGFRGSLQASTNAKRESTTFSESIYAEDIGKLPNTNLAESLNRIPGIQLRRDITGEGLQVSVRGLGPSFSKVLLNGSQIAIASDGGTEGGSSNREVDLDLFPSELFNRLDVSKSPQASTLEGGVAGVINLRNARPFDNPGFHVNVTAQGAYSDSNGQVSPRGSLLVNKTWDRFGVLLGMAGARTKSRVDGFDTIGWTDANITCTGCNAGLGTGNGFTYASVVPRNTGFGLTPGTPVDLAATSGLDLPTLSSALMPRLGRNSLTQGIRSRSSTLLALQYLPMDTLHFNLDMLYGKQHRNLDRINANWSVRNSSPSSTGGMVPIDITVDENNVITSGTFANSRFFIESSKFEQDLKFYNINPSMTWELNDKLVWDTQLNYSHSKFFREQPSWLFDTARESGLSVSYTNVGGPQPIIVPSQDIGDPSLGWVWNRVNIQNARRETNTKGAHTDLTWGDANQLSAKVGLAYDVAEREVIAYDNSPAYQAYVCGNPCTGGVGSAIPNSQLAQFLNRLPITDYGHLRDGNLGYSSFIVPDFDAIKAATNYAQFNDSAPITRSGVSNSPSGSFEEKTTGAYFELTGMQEVLSRALRYNAGVRFIHTDQFISGTTQNGTSFAFVTDDRTYKDYLPSVNLAYDLTEKIKVRAAASQTLTRADPNQLLPGATFGDPAARNANIGNPALQPYTSKNFDIGGEYYTGGAGYVGIALFRKNVDGFTAAQQSEAPFTSLGIPFSTLSSTQQMALLDRGGPDVATVTITQQVNLNKLTLKGAELTYVQPLDFLVRGTGVTINGTRITQSSDDNLFAPGIAPWTYNVTAYYEDRGISVHTTYYWNDDLVTLNPPNNGIAVPIRADSRGQWDLSASYAIPFRDNDYKVTLDVLNITNEQLRSTFGYDNATWQLFNPGRQILLGVRAAF